MLGGLSGPGHSLDPKFTKEYTTSKLVFMEVLILPFQHSTDPSNRTKRANQKARAVTCRSGLGHIVQEWEGKDMGGWGIPNSQRIEISMPDKSLQPLGLIMLKDEPCFLGLGITYPQPARSYRFLGRGTA